MKKLLMIFSFIILNNSVSVVGLDVKELEHQANAKREHGENELKQSYDHWINVILPKIQKEIHEKIGQNSKADHFNLIDLDPKTENQARGLCYIKYNIAEKSSVESFETSLALILPTGGSDLDDLTMLFKAALNSSADDKELLKEKIDEIINCDGIIAAIR